MSRIGKLPIAIPAGVTVNIDDKEHVITVKDGMTVEVKENGIVEIE